jgi:hypothetical protein
MAKIKNRYLVTLTKAGFYSYKNFWFRQNVEVEVNEKLYRYLSGNRYFSTRVIPELIEDETVEEVRAVEEGRVEEAVVAIPQVDTKMETPPAETKPAEEEKPPKKFTRRIGSDPTTKEE